jgi:hypothetical protein
MRRLRDSARTDIDLASECLLEAVTPSSTDDETPEDEILTLSAKRGAGGLLIAEAVQSLIAIRKAL